MRKVVSNSDVAHLFATREQEYAQNSSQSFWFQGDRLYSFGTHFCIARFVDDNTLLFNNQHYSNTTSKHVRLAWQATMQYKRIVCHNPTGSLVENFDDWRRKIELTLKSLEKARKQSIYLSALDRYKYEVEDYCGHFQIDVPEDIVKLLSVLDGKNVQELIAEEQRRDKVRGLRAHALNLVKFRQGEVFRMSKHDGYDYIRAEKDRFVTSQGVTIPRAVGLTFHKLLMANKIKVGDKIDAFTVKRVEPDYVVIGCHTITKEEMNNAVSSKTL